MSSASDLPKSTDECRETCLVLKDFIEFVNNISVVALQVSINCYVTNSNLNGLQIS